MERFIRSSLGENSGVDAQVASASGSYSIMELPRERNEGTQIHIPGDVGYLESELSRFVNSLFYGFQAVVRGTSRYLVSDVIVGRTNAEHNQLLRDIHHKLSRYQGDFALLSDHTDHIHFLHDCAFSNRSCRCSWYKTIPNLGECLRAKIRKIRLMSVYEKSDWINIVQYYSTGGRKCNYLKFRGRNRRVPVGLNHLQVGGNRGSQSEGQVEEGLPESNGDILCRFSDGSANRQGDGGPIRRVIKKGQFGNEIDSKIQLMLYKYPTTPIKNISDIMEWLDDPILRSVRNDHQTFKNCIDNWSKKICHWSLKEFKEYYSDAIVKPKFGAGYGSFDSIYYNVEDSFEIMEKILDYQFNGDENLILNFVTTLYNILERSVPKLNTILVHSPPSAGKNFFFDCVLDYMLVKGNLGNPNKNNLFAYMECVGKRVLLWNEPNYEKSEIENLKMLLGGDVFSVRVKNKEDAAVCRTPVIILTNNVISVMNDNAFKDRIAQYKWRSMFALKEYNKKPHPMVVEELFKKYIVNY